MTMGITDRHRTAVQSVAQLMLYRVASGQYATGQKLPSIRLLAGTLGVNRGTVEKAVRRLIKERILRSEAGRGVYVVRAPRTDANAWRDRIAASVHGALLEAKLGGLSRPQMVALVRDQIARVFELADGRPFAFFECNRWDADLMAQLLTRELHVLFAPVVLSDIDPRAPEWKQCRLCVTCLDHLAEVQELFPGRRIIGVQYTPATDSLLEIARLRRNIRLGVICHYPRTINLFVRTIEAIRPVTAVCVANDTAQLRSLLKNVDTVVVSRFAHDRVRALRPSAPLITMELRLTDQSLAFVKNEVASYIEKEVTARHA